MSTTDLRSPKSDTIRQFFDSIAAHYDFLNDFLSLRLDDGWRKKSRDLILKGNERHLLDLGTGTGKFIHLFTEAHPWERAVGLDFASNMLVKAKRSLPSAIEWVSADFHHLPFASEAFDLVISSFALRSVQDLPNFFREVNRVLQVSGKAGFLCLTRPKNKFWKALSIPYLKYYLPLVGGFLSGNRKAYGFLSQSVLTFQEPEATARMMEDAGFEALEIHRFSLGLATLIIGKKGRRSYGL